MAMMLDLLDPPADDASEARYSKPPSHSKRLDHLDGLRGVLCVLVVIHHFSCGWFPCSIFGDSAQWILDPKICSDDDYNLTLWIWAPIINGPFSVAVFFVLSGLVLAKSVQSGDLNRWKIATMKRYFRLALPVAAALTGAYVLSPFSYHEEASKITSSWWLKNFYSKAPTPYGLLQQLFVGVFHGTSTLNNAIWTMPIELIGSYLIYLLGMVFKDSNVVTKRKLLVGIFVILLLPSTTKRTGLGIRLEYGSSSGLSTILMDPVAHSGVLEKMSKDEWPIQYNKVESDPLYMKEEDPKPQGLDSPSKDHRNMDLLDQILNETPKSRELQFTESWKVMGSPYEWYAAFVAGNFLATLDYPSTVNPKSNRVSWYLWILFSLACASYPMTLLLISKNFLWRGMKQGAALLGFSSNFFRIGYYVIGATATVHVVAQPGSLQRFFARPMLRYLGRISFALYLTHIPILYSLTARLFVLLHNDYLWSYTGAAWTSLWFSLPIMLGVAALFERHIDGPAIQISGKIARDLLGINPSPPTAAVVTSL